MLNYVVGISSSQIEINVTILNLQLSQLHHASIQLPIKWLFGFTSSNYSASNTISLTLRGYSSSHVISFTLCDSSAA